MNEQDKSTWAGSLTRREWIAGAAAVASVAVLPPSLCTKIDAGEHAWIDAHSHISTR